MASRKRPRADSEPDVPLIARREPAQATDTWAPYLFNLVGDIAGKMWDFCAGSFRGFTAGGVPVSTDRHEDQYADERPAKRQQISQTEWVVVQKPTPKRPQVTPRRRPRPSIARLSSGQTKQSPRAASFASPRSPVPSPAEKPYSAAIEADLQRYSSRRQKESRRADASIQRLNDQLQAMIRQGKEALATTIQVENRDKHDDEGFVDGTLSHASNRHALQAPSMPPYVPRKRQHDGKAKPTFEDNKAYLDSLEESSSRSSDVDSDDFEPVLQVDTGISETIGTDDRETESDWESAIEPAITGDLELTLDSVHNVSVGALPNLGKKGPSKVEREIRVNTHCMHVQCLLYHNLIRNGWTCDTKVQEMLLKELSPGVRKEVDRWREACKRENHDDKKDRVVDASDPTVRLLKYLSAYWRKRFTITAPGLRKQGWKDAVRLEEEVKSFRQAYDQEVHGERLDRSGFCKQANKCEGSRDVGAQLFTALLRGIGLETRMVTNLQPIGFGWSKGEEALPKREKKPLGARPVHVKTINDRNRGTALKPITVSDSESELSPVPSDDSLVDVTPAIPDTSLCKYDRDLAWPVYWSEVLSPITMTWIPVDAIVLSVIATGEEGYQAFEPRGVKAEKGKQVIAYVVAFSSDGTAKDVTVRYLKRHTLPGKTKGFRIGVEKVPVYNRRGKILKYREQNWIAEVMAIYKRPAKKQTSADKLEDERELKPVRPNKKARDGAQDTLQGYKSSAEFVLERHLRREEALLPTAKPVKTFKVGAKDEPVFKRIDVVSCKTVESWHKEGRSIRANEQPLKHVPVRAVTTLRKREIEEAERTTGEKMMQGLYAKRQTQWIVPPPIKDGVIPKNSYGNMDVYVPSMVPKGAVHVPLGGTAKLCRRLEIDYAEACTGFDFGNRRAVPVITGVVVAAEHEDALIDLWEEEAAIKRKKENDKREKLALTMWKKMISGLKVIERVKTQYSNNSHFD